MELGERINKIKPYFKVFNVLSDAAYICVEFPRNWKMFKSDFLLKKYNVEQQAKDGNYYFVADLSVDTNNLFDAVERVITYNKEIEEKSRLFEEKVKELSEIFANESLSKLKNIQFTFSTFNGIDIPDIEHVDEENAETNDQEKQEVIEETDEPNETIEEETDVVQENKPQKDGVSLLGFAENIAKNKNRGRK